MYGSAKQAIGESRLISPQRNHYFHGKMMDAYHFALETEYNQHMRRMINRLAVGYGVVCGLDVVPGESTNGESARSIHVSKGFALDKWGREIVVPEVSAAIKIDDEVIARAMAIAGEGSEKPCENCREHHKDQVVDDDKGVYVHVVICYHECHENPMPVLAGDCDGASLCAPGMIREWYHLEVRPGHMSKPSFKCGVVNAVTAKTLNYEQLVQWVTYGGDDPDDSAGCPGACEPCIPLANVHIPMESEGCAREGSVEAKDIDIYIRPIVYPNDLLFEMFLDMVIGRGPNRTVKS